MKIGFRTSPQNTDWASLEAAWAEAGRHDVFESGRLNDPLSQPRRDQGGPSMQSRRRLGERPSVQGFGNVPLCSSHESWAASAV